MINFIKELFSFKWRWNRLKFWIYPLVVYLLAIIPVVFIVISMSAQEHSNKAKEVLIKSNEMQIQMAIDSANIEWKTQEQINNSPELIKMKQETQKLKEEMIASWSKNYEWSSTFYMIILLIPFIIISLWVSLAAYAKRLHDLDKSGWWALISLIPYISIILLIYCGFFRWTAWKNRFWDNPLGNMVPEKTQDKTPDEL